MVLAAQDVYKRDWKLLKDKGIIQQTLELLCCCNYLREIYEDKKPKRQSAYKTL